MSSTSLLKSPWVLLAVAAGVEVVAVPKSDIAVEKRTLMRVRMCLAGDNVKGRRGLGQSTKLVLELPQAMLLLDEPHKRSSVLCHALWIREM